MWHNGKAWGLGLLGFYRLEFKSQLCHDLDVQPCKLLILWLSFLVWKSGNGMHLGEVYLLTRRTGRCCLPSSVLKTHSARMNYPLEQLKGLDRGWLHTEVVPATRYSSLLYWKESHTLLCGEQGTHCLTDNINLPSGKLPNSPNSE